MNIKDNASFLPSPSTGPVQHGTEENKPFPSGTLTREKLVLVKVRR